MNKLKCIVCNKIFVHKYSHTKFCTQNCRYNYYSDKYRRKVIGIKIPTGTVGAMSEMLISVDLFRKGFSVFRALSPACFCDVIACKDNKLYKIEVRTGYKAANNKLSFSRGINNFADIYGIWERNTGEIIYLDKEYNIIENL